MKFNNVHQIFSTNLTNIHKCLEEILFTRRTESSFFVGIYFDSVRPEKSISSKHLWMIVKLSLALAKPNNKNFNLSIDI